MTKKNQGRNLFHMQSVTVIFLMLISFVSHISAQTDPATKQVNAYVEHLMQRQGIPGVALAIIKNGKVIHQKYFGYANLEHQVPVTANSIFRVYSLTKPVISVAVFQLIEEGKLQLDDVISQHVDGLPLAWQSVQIKHLLTHSSGFPDMAPFHKYKDFTEEESKNRVFAEALKFPAGKQYDYNQTNFWLLQQVIEKLGQTSLSEFVIKRQFKNAPDAVFFSSDSRDIIRHRATPYFYFSRGELSLDHSYMQGDYGHAMNGLNLTLNAFVNWDRKLNQGEFLNDTTQQLMLKAFNYTDSNKVFAHAWDKINVNGHVSYGFTGSLVTAYRTFPDENMSIVFLSNGLSYWYNIDNIINHIASLIDPKIQVENNHIYETLLRASLEHSFDEFKNIFTRLTNNPNYQGINFEKQLNDVGYMLLNIKNIKKAIEVFKFNTSVYPQSWNAYDSLGEALEKNGELKKALMQYKKALSLNSTNQYQRNAQLKDKIALLTNGLNQQ
ncbi:serine hydrolase [Marinicella sp. W31]|uniref:serine hydrolase n=1 Tax=Marinicella sp. W31 TaxID=3023713 RepID=UPI0037564626